MANSPSRMIANVATSQNWIIKKLKLEKKNIRLVWNASRFFFLLVGTRDLYTVKIIENNNNNKNKKLIN